MFYASRGSEDTKERLLFAQSKYSVHLKKTSFQVIGKYQYTSDLYEDYAAPTASRYLKNEYFQNEGYLSGVAVWNPLQGLHASVASDVALNTLHSNLSRNSEVTRSTLLTTESLQYKNSRISLKTNLLATIINEDACDNPDIVSHRRISPYAGISVRPFKGSGLRLRYFFKETYRVPNFSEMYYFVMPLDTLRPECATQHNIGVTLPPIVRYSSDSTSHRTWSVTIDGYRNNVKDKIIAVPRQNMCLWSTMNLGFVEVTGMDINGSLDWSWSKVEFCGSVTYSYQNAVDRTNPLDEKVYGNQIPYTPRHSGGLTLSLGNPWVNVGYSCMLVGERYYKQQNSDATRLPSYADHGITLDRSFELPVGDLKLQFQLLNIFNVQYEVVRSYPMMGRNFRIKASYTF